MSTIEIAAEMSGSSVRTLQRRLTESAATYEEVVDRVRFETAICLLRNSRTTLSRVASELGYADQANFTRAVHRWAGHSPSAFHRLLETNRLRACRLW